MVEARMSSSFSPCFPILGLGEQTSLIRKRTPPGPYSMPAFQYGVQAYRGTSLIRKRTSLGPYSMPASRFRVWAHRGASLIRKRTLLGPYGRPMHRVLRCSQGVEDVLELSPLLFDSGLSFKGSSFIVNIFHLRILQYTR